MYDERVDNMGGNEKEKDIVLKNEYKEKIMKLIECVKEPEKLKYIYVILDTYLN